MCRREMYFKGMYKVAREWEKERVDKKNEEAFSQAFDEIFEEYSDSESEYSDSESDTDSWETWSDSEPETESDVPPPPPVFETSETSSGPWKDGHYSDFILYEIKLLQKEYKKSMELGVDFDWYLDNYGFFVIEDPPTVYIEDDVFPHMKNLFVSNHKSMVRNKRSGKRVASKNDTSFTMVLTLMF